MSVCYPPGILIVGNFLSEKTSTRGVCEDLADELRLEGWSVVTTSNRRAKVARLIDISTTIWFKRHKYSVAQVDVFSGRAFILAEIACQLLRIIGKPFVITLHGGNLPKFASRWPGRLERLFASASEVTTPSQFLLEKMRIYRHDIRSIPNPLRVERYAYRLRRAPRPKLVWLRAFHRIYNPALAPKVIADLMHKYPHVKLVMIGPDKSDGSFQQTKTITHQLGLDSKIIFKGGIDKEEVPRFLGEADIFLNTTNIDNTPVSVIEAMACGLCIVSTDVGGIPYLLDNEKNGLLVPPDDPGVMVSAVQRLLRDNGLAEMISRNARLKAEQYDVNLVIPQWENLLISVAR